MFNEKTLVIFSIFSPFILTACGVGFMALRSSKKKWSTHKTSSYLLMLLAVIFMPMVLGIWALALTPKPNQMLNLFSVSHASAFSAVQLVYFLIMMYEKRKLGR